MLGHDERARAAARHQVAPAEVGDSGVPHRPRPACWFGLIDGLLKMSNDSAAGAPLTFTGVPPGGWFGEGTLLKREPYRYNIEALRQSMVAGLPSRPSTGCSTAASRSTASS